METPRLVSAVSARLGSLAVAGWRARHQKRPARKHLGPTRILTKRWFGFTVALFALIVLVAGVTLWLDNSLRPHTLITQSATHDYAISFSQTTRYTEPGFSIELPASWKQSAKPVGASQNYAWQSGDQSDTGQVLNLYEDDAIPENFPINHVVTVTPAGAHLDVSWAVSRDCGSFTASKTPLPNELGVDSQYQGLPFLCDRRSKNYSVTGIVAPGAINSVTLTSPSTGSKHRFFLDLLNYGTTEPDYDTFYAILSSLRVD